MDEKRQSSTQNAGSEPDIIRSYGLWKNRSPGASRASTWARHSRRSTRLGPSAAPTRPNPSTAPAGHGISRASTGVGTSRASTGIGPSRRSTGIGPSRASTGIGPTGAFTEVDPPGASARAGTNFQDIIAVSENVQPLNESRTGVTNQEYNTPQSPANGDTGSRGKDYVNASGLEIWQAARAATAADLYFEPLVIHNGRRRSIFTDGGFGPRCNPTEDGIDEVKNKYGDHSLTFVISVGTLKQLRQLRAI